MRLLLLLVISLPAYCAAGACPSGLPVTGNNCYFIAASGSDSAAGNSESVPWLHAPNMPNCSAVCAGVSPSPGQGFIFRGGDTWHFGNSGAAPYTGGGWNINNSWGTDASCIFEGTTSGCIYYGVDKTWYTGGSWVRPVLTGDNTTSTSLVSSCAHQIAGSFWGSNTMMLMGVATILDNFEITGMCSQDANPTSGVGDTIIGYAGTGTNGSGSAWVVNVYIHGWTATTGAGQGNTNLPGTLIGGGANGLQILDHIVIDGSDSNPGSWAWGTFPSFYHFRDSIVRYTTNGVGQWCHDIHDNIFEHFYNHNAGAGSHANILECNDNATGTPVNQPQNTPNVFYNNMFRHDDPSFGAGGQVHWWVCPEVVPEYYFNNILYDIANENYIDMAGPPIYGCPNTGGQFMFNNTLVDGSQPCYLPNNTAGGTYLTVLNEHLINTPYDSGTTPCTGHGSATDIAMTDATAETQGYLVSTGGTTNSDTCANDTTPCAPTLGSNSTVGAGANHQAYCTALAAYSTEPAIGTDAANACKYATTDGCAYNTSTHTMTCPAQAVVLRPASTAWDAGAYEYQSGNPSAGAPSFSPSAGTYTGTQSVTISSSPSTVICYNTTGSPATNGSTGCTVGTLYSAPVAVVTSETLYAAAGGTGYTDTDGSAAYTINTCAITPASLGPYTAGQSISQQFTASNCTASSFTISSGSLSGSGLTLSSGGLLSGTAQSGSFSFTVAYNTATDPISLIINASVIPNPPTSLTAAPH